MKRRLSRFEARIAGSRVDRRTHRFGAVFAVTGPAGALVPSKVWLRCAAP